MKNLKKCGLFQKRKFDAKLERKLSLEERDLNRKKYIALKDQGKLNVLEGVYVAVSKDGIIASSKDPQEITKKVLENSTTFTTRVGSEEFPCDRKEQILLTPK